MPKPINSKRRARKRVKGKVKLTQRARIVEKNDATSVARTDTQKYRKVKVRPPADVAPTFRIKIRKKI
jgi:hypothetical protein